VAELDLSVASRQRNVSVVSCSHPAVQLYSASRATGLAALVVKALMYRPKDADHTIHRLILGTHTSGQNTDQLMIAEVVLPKSGFDANGKEVSDVYDDERQGMLRVICASSPPETY
jgi:hypothetical protein